MKRIQMTLAAAQRGASAIEYALIAGLLAVILVAAVTLLGDGFDTTFQNIVDCMTGNGCSFGDGGGGDA